MSKELIKSMNQQMKLIGKSISKMKKFKAGIYFSFKMKMTPQKINLTRQNQKLYKKENVQKKRKFRLWKITNKKKKFKNKKRKSEK